MNRIKAIAVTALSRVLSFWDLCIEKCTIPFKNLYVRHLHRDNERAMNRRILLAASLVLILDYLLVCYHVGRNPLDILPGIPKLDGRDTAIVYVADLDGKTILTEKRRVERDDTDENYALQLVNHVVRGSQFENTRSAVPFSGAVRRIWFFGDTCVVDFRPEFIDENVPVLPGSEDTFRKALADTIIKNMSGVKNVVITQNGIYGRRLWEIPFTDDAPATPVAAGNQSGQKPL